MYVHTLRSVLLCAVLLMPLCVGPADGAEPEPAPAPALVKVVLQTSVGNIEVALEAQRAPLTTANFLRYVDLKRLDGLTFYRAVKVGDEGKYGLVQGGVQGDRRRTLPPVAHEAPSITGVSNVDGAISMAREAPGSATADFFFVIGDLTSLDGDASKNDPGYAAFGHVTAGMDLLHAILERPRSAEARDPGMKGQMLAEPVKIFFVRRVP